MKRSFKIISILLVLVLMLGLLAACGAKKEEPKNAVYVTLSNACEIATDKNGALVAAVALEIPEAGSTVGDVIIALHKNLAKGGEADYATAENQYGPSISKLWGVENGGAYGYYVNGAMSMGLSDPVKAGDKVDLMIYKDAATFSDAYVILTATASGTKVNVKTESMGFDANFNPVMSNLKGAKIYYVDGKKLVDTKAVTGEDGTASFELKAGTYRIVAITEGETPFSAAAAKVTTSK